MSAPLTPEMADAVQRGRDISERLVDEAYVENAFRRIYRRGGFGEVLSVISRATDHLLLWEALDPGLIELSDVIARARLRDGEEPTP